MTLYSLTNAIKQSCFVSNIKFASQHLHYVVPVAPESLYSKGGDKMVKRVVGTKVVPYSSRAKNAKRGAVLSTRGIRPCRS